MANTQLASYESYLFGGLTSDDIKTVHETIAKDCTEAQFKLFMGVAKAADANPLIGEIHPTVYQGKLTWQFAVDYHVRKAKEMDGYRGYDVQIVHANDDFQYHQERAEDGRYYIAIDKHIGGFPTGAPIGGYAIAYKEGFMPFTVLMDVEEVDHFKKSAIGMQKTMWTNNFKDMFKKHMVKRAMKAAFGLRFDDNDGAEPTPGYDPYERADVTPTTSATDPEVINPGGTGTDSSGDSGPTEADRLKQARTDMKLKFQQLGITSNEEMAAYIEKKAKPKGDKPTLKELTGLLKIMDLDIAEKRAMQAADDELPI
ncbi:MULTISPECIES: recombinase RecT [unclassified Paenibacillus]|uniref:recombinase RecT n=1 Tax=unclassified Paenibacillus TaxID=185978 RepID=UPI0024073166|nr:MULTISPECIES: recombinase RecT [unclassified Paenibacillus]MDF9844184.1 recombination protein RecT [Paenibacillus sp. PastF-2]MDF9850694.1 recombination protein RecT [Paenibacillus sp. PastM-2]MDF9857265.1 recombination protein RecT [Paenibacillus sp. PastF-1]MDH6482627.1 recombination protein RecT [Paenibacillus sp. PastH-2]MDH6510054.1 recombination protein RecT [Paenibacillus sp. PastM-3]